MMLFKKLSDVSETEMQKLLSRGSGLEDVVKTVSAVLLDVRTLDDKLLFAFNYIGVFFKLWSLKRLFPA